MFVHAHGVESAAVLLLSSHYFLLELLKRQGLFSFSLLRTSVGVEGQEKVDFCLELCLLLLDEFPENFPDAFLEFGLLLELALNLRHCFISHFLQPG